MVQEQSPAAKGGAIAALVNRSIFSYEVKTMASIRDIAGDPDDVWDEASWDEMTAEEKRLWKVLGWDAASWEEEIDPPETDDLYDEMTAPQRAALTELGYTKSLWDRE